MSSIHRSQRALEAGSATGMLKIAALLGSDSQYKIVTVLNVLLSSYWLGFVSDLAATSPPLGALALGLGAAAITGFGCQ